MDTTKLIEEAKKHFTPNIAPAPFVIDRADGSYLWDTEGNQYLDFSTGIAVNNLGHRHPAVIAAIQKQLTSVLHTSNMYWNKPSMDLAEKLTQLSFANRAYICNSGTEANEAAFKLSRKYFADQGKARGEFVSFFHSFRGRTYGSLSATGQEKYWKGFEPLVPGFKFGKYNDLSAVDLISENTAAVIVEPIQGEGGVFPAKVEFLQALRKKCDQTKTLLIFDEIQVGIGRTGSMFAYEQYGITPDIMTLAKGLGGGLPIGAMVTTEEVGKHLIVGSHATTFGGNPVCCAAANAVLETLTNPSFFPELKANAESFKKMLDERIGKLPAVVDIRGKGMMIGLEMKEDISKLFDQLRLQKVLVTRIPPKVLRILPPLTATPGELKTFVEELERAITAVC